MIFNCNLYCSLADSAEIEGSEPVTLGGDGLWVGVLSRGGCALQQGGRSGTVGDILLGRAPVTLHPGAECHLLAVCLQGRCTDALLLALGESRFADGAACPGAAEVIAQLHTAPSPAAPYALLAALAHADETVRPLPPLVASAVQAIRQNYMALYGVEELSEQLGVSKAHLVRVFKEEMGLPPGKYLTAIRLENAKALLLQNEYNLEMIAGLCGFSGANYFCRVFKREVGVSPAAWRTAAQPLRTVPSLPARSDHAFV